MKDIEITTHGDFQAATKPGGDEFIAWAKIGRIQSDCPIEEPGSHVWFSFGATREIALSNVLKELGLKNG